MGAARGGGRRQRPGEGPGRGRSMERGWRGAEERRGLSWPDSAARDAFAPLGTAVPRGLPASIPVGRTLCKRRGSPSAGRDLQPRAPAASSSLRPPQPAGVRAVNSAPRLEPARHRPASGPAPAAPAPSDWSPVSSQSSSRPGGGLKGGPGGTCPAAPSGAGVWGRGLGGCCLPRSPSRMPACP